MHAITATGLDIAKSVFQVHGVDAEGKVVFRRTPSRRCPFGASTTKLMVITTSPLNTPIADVEMAFCEALAVTKSRPHIVVAKVALKWRRRRQNI